jgi:hypothetical protein
MTKYENWVVRICALSLGSSGLLAGLYVSIWINHRYGEQQDVRFAQIAVTTALITVGYIAGEMLARYLFHIINRPKPSRGEEVKDVDNKDNEKAPLSLCGMLVPPPSRANGGQFATRQTPPCHKWDSPAVRWEIPEYYPQGRKAEGEN